ncbi:diacylglycerol kinase [Desulfopila sp. IMCC35008]|uniref:diacylglycerol kinase n=1 Tax=Desulfopila sp. IMCC35008 TaxID=2653858 RepID=UPI0013CF641E|nr:diacylglycerol kinase [Desulfopila sp. IMCC35008]
MKPAKRGISRIIAAFFYSLQGIKSCLKHEEAFRQEAALVLLLLPVILFLPVATTTKLSLFLVNMLILIVEMLNSAIEAIVDMTSPEYHDLAKRAKDVGSGAVFLAILTASVFWLHALFGIYSK